MGRRNSMEARRVRARVPTEWFSLDHSREEGQIQGKARPHQKGIDTGTNNKLC